MEAVAAVDLGVVEAEEAVALHASVLVFVTVVQVALPSTVQQGVLVSTVEQEGVVGAGVEEDSHADHVGSTLELETLTGVDDEETLTGVDDEDDHGAQAASEATTEAETAPVKAVAAMKDFILMV